MATKTIPEVSDYLAYEVDTCILYFKDRQQEIQSGEIHSFSIGCNYNGEEFFPEFSINLMIDRKTFFDIMKEKDDLTMLLKVSYYTVTPKNNETTEKGRKRVWFNDRFVIYMDDKHFDTLLEQNEEMMKEFKVSNNPDSDIPQHKEYNLSFFLYKEDDINVAYYVSNKVYTNTDKTTLVSHLLTKSHAKNVLMSPISNSNIQEAMTLPITTIANLRYLDAQYGLHSHGTLIFFDLDLLYILNKKVGCTAWRKGENTNIVFTIRNDTDEKSFMGGSRLNPDDGVVYVNLSPENLSYQSYSSMDNLIYGGQVKLIDTDNNSVDVVNTKAPIRKIQTKFMHNKYGKSELLQQHLQQRLSDRGMVATISISDANINWFRPNKDFSFTFMNPKLESVLGGKYKMLNIFMKFSHTGEYFRNETTMQYAKAF